MYFPFHNKYLIISIDSNYTLKTSIILTKFWLPSKLSRTSTQKPLRRALKTHSTVPVNCLKHIKAKGFLFAVIGTSHLAALKTNTKWGTGLSEPGGLNFNDQGNTEPPFAFNFLIKSYKNESTSQCCCNAGEIEDLGAQELISGGQKCPNWLAWSQ